MPKARVLFPTLFAALASAMVARSACGSLLFSHASVVSNAGIASSSTSFRALYAYGSTPDQPTLFETGTWSIADIGTTRLATASLDPDFTAFAGYLTDGVGGYDQLIDFLLDGINGGGVGYSDFEAAYVYGNPSDPRVDLHGYRVDSLALRLDSLTVATPGSNPNHDGIWTDYSAHFTLSAFGDVPEPTLPGIASAAAATMLLRRRARSNRLAK
jgi:hypothetical protein